MSAATMPTTGMASTRVIRTKLSGITSISTDRMFERPDCRPPHAPGTSPDAASYPEAADRGKKQEAPRGGVRFRYTSFHRRTGRI